MKNKELEEITQILLNKDSSDIDLLNSTRGLSRFFENFSPICTEKSHFEVEDQVKHTYLDSGIAISPLDAAICTNEYMRTTKYIRGIYEAISDLLLKFTDEKIHILYAGCGPYATLIIPILSYFDSDRLEVSFLDIHKSSLDSVKSILEGLGLESFTSEYIQEDATKYKVSKDTHLMITETMKAAFADEPQVSITLNLLPQLCKDGVFIPESVNIHLEASLKTFVEKDNCMENLKESEYLADIIKLDSKKQWNKVNLILTPTLEIKEDIKDGYELFLCTQIKVYKNHILNENECSLNLPLQLFLATVIVKGDILEFSYEFENRPGILYKHIKKDKSISNNRDFYPSNISFRYKNSMIVWQKYLSKRFLRPFFSDEVKIAVKKYISWKELNELANSSEYIEPNGFIFHASRCGSTLLSNALSSLEKNIVIKESPFIHDILTLDYKEDILKDELKKRVRDSIKILGKKRFDSEENFYIKFNCWEIANIDMIRELYPHTPIIILYREPKEILSSHKKISGMQMVPNLLEGKIFDAIPEDIASDSYPSNVLENIFEYSLLAKDKDGVIFVNYKDIKNIFFSKIAPFFNLDLNDKEKEIMRDSFGLYSKDQSRRFDKNKEHNNEIFVSDRLKNSFTTLENIKVCYGSE